MGKKGMATREEDYVVDVFTASTHDYILFFTDTGKVYRKKGYQIPESGKTAKGTNIVEATRNLDMVTVLGLPVRSKWDNKLYNCAAVIQSGEILGLVPKTYLPNYGEFYEQRWFASGSGCGDQCGPVRGDRGHGRRGALCL